MSNTAKPGSDNYLIAQLDLSDPKRVDLAVAADELIKATTDCGFVYIAIGDKYASTIKSVRCAQRSFFNQTLIKKAGIGIDINNRGYLASGMAQMHGAARKDEKEVFFWGREALADDPDVLAGHPLCGPNQWPAVDNFRVAVESYSAMVKELGDKLLEIIAVALDAPADFFKPYYQRSMLRGQLLCYPPTGDHPDQFGVAPHSDFGCITLLLQETPGLEVLFPSGEWVPAPPLANTLVVNIGDLLERWSNNRFPSTRHRVRNQSSEARYSIAMFYDPNPGAIVDPLDLLPQEDSQYPAVKAAEYILSQNKGAFSHYSTT